MNITRRSLFGILAGAAAAPAIPAPSTPIEDVRRAMREMGSQGLKVNMIIIHPSVEPLLESYFEELRELGVLLRRDREAGSPLRVISRSVKLQRRHPL